MFLQKLDFEVSVLCLVIHQDGVLLYVHVGSKEQRTKN